MMPLSTRGGCPLRTVVLAALLNSLTGPVVLSHPSEPHVAEAQSIGAPTCDAENVGVTQVSSSPIVEMPLTEIAAARNYLIETASPGYTMARQGPELAIGRLNPEFVIRLANAVREARQAGLASVGVFSAYRPPAFGVGGFLDKFHSLHTYGLDTALGGLALPQRSFGMKLRPGMVSYAPMALITRQNGIIANRRVSRSFSRTIPCVVL